MLAKQQASRQNGPQTPKETAFKLHARKKQSAFRQMILGVPYDPKHQLGRYGAFLSEPWAGHGFNFCEEYRSDILYGIRCRYGKDNQKILDNLKGNMLRSEHIPWNIFYPMKAPQNQTTTIGFLQELLGVEEISEITDIRIEWAPEKETALDDNTAFDTYIEYVSKGEHYGVGIEVKYTERTYPIGVLEKDRILNQPECLYAMRTQKSGLFVKKLANRPLGKNPLCGDNYRQIWRNHLLGESMVMNGAVKGFRSITIYPKGNPHFAMVLPKYEEFLSSYGKSTFAYFTFEELFLLMYKYFATTEQNCRWIDYLNTRYPFR